MKKERMKTQNNGITKVKQEERKKARKNESKKEITKSRNT